MLTIFLWATIFLYAGQAVISGWNGNYPMVGIMFGYCFSNLALIWSINSTQ